MSGMRKHETDKQQLSVEKRIAIFVNHDVLAVMEFHKRSIFLNKGMIEYYGQSRYAIERYLKHSKNYSKNPK